MTMPDAYDQLMEHVRETTALEQISGLLSWDQETMMPAGAAKQRAALMGALESQIHARRSDPRVGEWLEEVDLPGKPDSAERRAQVRHVRRAHDRAVKVPGRLSAEIARVTSEAQGIWAAARKADDFGAFAPAFAEVIRLKREEAAALSDGSSSLYEVLLQDYEPGMTLERLDGIFGSLRPRLVALRDRILGSSVKPPELGFEFPEEIQAALARKLAEAFGYDFSRGRLDVAVHPFSSGSGSDVRITTRFSRRDPFNCLYSTIHETGHAVYEQSIDSAYAGTPVGSGVSMGVHESQSRIFENQLGRSRAFTGWLYGQMRAEFGDFGVSGEDAFHLAANRVSNGYIRTEADEVQYNLHVLLRLGIEREIVEGRLEVSDVEEAWNSRFESDFGFPVDKASNGALQDVHWSVGLFGYFPTYTLGNVYAGCLHAAMRRAVPSLDDDLSRGSAESAVSWLREHVQRHGGLHEPVDLISSACGSPPGEAPLLEYLEGKFGALYGV